MNDKNMFVILLLHKKVTAAVDCRCKENGSGKIAR